MEKAITAAKPDKLTQDYLANVFGFSGGSDKAAIPILKRVGFLTADGTPTELYSKFRSDTSRPEAAYFALKNGFAELFRRSEHIYAAPDSKLTDLIVETTGLAKSDKIVSAIKGTFRAFAAYLPSGFSVADIGQERATSEPDDEHEIVERSFTDDRPSRNNLGLSYHINIVLPESKDPEVYNAIFKSLRENLLRT